MKIHFHTEENLFSYGGKSIFIRRKIHFRRKESEISTEEWTNSSELRNLSSEVSFHSSELLYPASVGIIIRHHEVTILVAFLPSFYNYFPLLGLEAL